jgi:AbrB family looped-hinge helix DNA binding protein
MKILGDSKVTDKFQATIPRAVRDLLRLDSGDRIVFVMEHDYVAVKKGRLEVEA